MPSSAAALVALNAAERKVARTSRMKGGAMRWASCWLCFSSRARWRSGVAMGRAHPLRGAALLLASKCPPLRARCSLLLAARQKIFGSIVSRPTRSCPATRAVIGTILQSHFRNARNCAGAERSPAADPNRSREARRFFSPARHARLCLRCAAGIGSAAGSAPLYAPTKRGRTPDSIVTSPRLLSRSSRGRDTCRRRYRAWSHHRPTRNCPSAAQ